MQSDNAEEDDGDHTSLPGSLCLADSVWCLGSGVETWTESAAPAFMFFSLFHYLTKASVLS